MPSFTPSDIKLFVSHLAMPAFASYQLSGKLLTKNAAFEQVFAFDRNDVDPFFEKILHAESQNPYAQFCDEIASLANGKEKSEQLLNLKNKNNEWVWYTVYASLYPVNNDAEQNIIVFTFAIQSSHAELRHRLAESEQRFKTLADASFGGIAIHDKGVILEANQGLSKMTGFTYDELIGMNGLLLIAPIHRNYVMERIVSGYEEPYEAVGIRKDDSTYPLEIQGKQVLHRGKLVSVTEFRDITQRKEFEKAIIESEVKYKQIIDFAVDGFIIGNSNGIVIEVNNRLIEIVGRTRDEVLGMHISSFFSQKVLEQTPFRFDMLEKGETVVSQREITRPNGDTVFIEMHSKQMPDGTYQAMVRDVTERVSIENSVRQSEKLYRSIIENIEDVYFRYDLNQQLVLVSPSGASLFGFSSVNQMLGLPMDAFWVNSEEKQQFLEMLRTEGKARDYRTTLKTKKGKIITAYLSASYISNSKGERVGVEGIIHDITQRAKAEKALEHEQFLMRNLMDNVIDQVYFKDKESKFIRVSKNVAQRFGLKRSDDVLGKSDFDFFSREYAQKTYGNEQSIIATGKPLVNLEEKEVWKDGKVTWASTTKMPLFDPDGNVVGIFGISRDITERKLYEIALKEREERAIRQRMAIAELAVDNRVAEANLSEAFTIVVKKSAEALAVARVGIWLLSDDKQSLTCFAMYDSQKGRFVECHPLSVDDYPVYFKSIYKENRTFVNDVLTDERVKELRPDYLQPNGISSLLDAGITIEGHLAGVVCFEHVGQKRKWEVDEESFAATIASFVGQTILSSRRKESEKALAKSEERFRYVLQATNDGVWDWDLKSNKTFYSDNYYTMLGYKPGEFELAYQSWIDLMHPNDKEFTQILIRKYLKEESPDFNAEFRLKAKDGSWRWIHARGKVVEYDNDRKPLRVVGTHIDITERKQMEDELRDSANFLQTVLDTIPVRLFWKDTKLRYLGCNTQFAKDMGYNKPSNIIGKTDDELFQAEQNNQFRSDDLAIIKTGIPIVTPEELLITPS
ncbi:MAG TPA: PAS domain S-box protein, partial [Bacteroidetes bacterium]|nr:PAS domain S-box protein [Bacteroidota bacterium]